ncbi:putative exported protein [Proteus hauseri ATCC 700826]|uniref:Exported protein n=1 Tax=Proteus hauseri ATCC 700826 TaxID=1354271 RepID=A0AAJ3LST9_PROHU|nr:putative exported protein [Proteus hauseri ATCC 700826]
MVVIHLPKIGIKGNTYFLFSDLNNIQIAHLISQFLEQKNPQ